MSPSARRPRNGSFDGRRSGPRHEPWSRRERGCGFQWTNPGDRGRHLGRRSISMDAATTARKVEKTMGGLNTPFGGKLVNLLVNDERASEMRATAKDFASLTLDERGICDLELLAVGGFSPLTGFLGKKDYANVLAEGRLQNGTLWPLPVTLSVKPGE